MFYRKIDELGLFREDVINPEITEGEEHLYISKPVPPGFFHPKWDGEKWIEGMPQEQIDELKNLPVELTTEQQEIQMLKRRLDETENALLQTIDSILIGGM